MMHGKFNGLTLLHIIYSLPRLTHHEGNGIFFVTINKCCYNEEYNVMVNSEELISSTISDTTDKVSH